MRAARPARALKPASGQKVSRGVVARAGGEARLKVAAYLDVEAGELLRRYCAEHEVNVSDFVEQATSEFMRTNGIAPKEEEKSTMSKKLRTKATRIDDPGLDEVQKLMMKLRKRGMSNFEIGMSLMSGAAYCAVDDAVTVEMFEEAATKTYEAVAQANRAVTGVANGAGAGAEN